MARRERFGASAQEILRRDVDGENIIMQMNGDEVSRILFFYS